MDVEQHIEEIEEDEQPRRRRIQRVKSHEIMLQECERYVAAGKRLPKLHSRWLLNLYVNAGSSIHAMEQAHNYTRSQLEQAQATIKQLREHAQVLQQTES